MSALPTREEIAEIIRSEASSPWMATVVGHWEKIADALLARLRPAWEHATFLQEQLDGANAEAVKANTLLRSARADRDEMQRKGESLCRWIGALLTNLAVSTPEEGIQEVERMKADLERCKAELAKTAPPEAWRPIKGFEGR